jgi:hypothetical protein
MDSHQLWLVIALVLFLVASIQGFFGPASPTQFYMRLHPGWLACAAVVCFFLIK